MQRMAAATVVALRCRVFAAQAAPLDTSYANPLAAFDGQRGGHPLSFRFPSWLVVEAELSSGHVGLGDTGLAPALAAEYVDTQLAPIVVGARAADLEATWQRLYRATVPTGRRGLGMAAISAVDLALWDAYARLLGVPVHGLLGGRKRDAVPVYASRLYGGGDLDALAEEAASYRDQGFRAVKQRFVWGPADGLAGLRRNLELVRTVRQAVGDDVDLMTDAYMGFDLEYATRLARLLEPYGVRWLEEPLLPDDLAGYRELRRRSPVPIAGGEHESTLAGVRELVHGGAVDVLQIDTGRVGGLTVARKAAALAEAAGVPLIPHAGQMRNYHLVASQPACPMAEYFPPGEVDVGNELPHLLFAGEPVAERGEVVVGDQPGFGLTVDPREPVREVARGPRE
jgi:L-rhamnonate dehydratase